MSYPNMSYCMCENTALALNQVLTAIREDGTDFLREMGREERRAFQELFSLCEAFIEDANDLQSDYEEEQRNEKVFSDEDA